MNGPQTHPVYKILKDQQPQDLPNGFMIPGEKGRITWNYTSMPKSLTLAHWWYRRYLCLACF